MADRLVRCALESEKIAESQPMGQIHKLYKCQSRYCEFCSWKEAARFCKRYTPRISHQLNEGLKLAFSTFTIPNASVFHRGDFESLYQCFKKLLNQKPMKQAFLGSLAKLETTYNPVRQEYHPHIHSLILFSKRIPQREISDAWGVITESHFGRFAVPDIPDSRTAFRSVWIRKIIDGKQSPEKIKWACSEAIKYICKFNPILDPNAFADYFRATKGKRLLRAHGVLHS